MYKIDEQLLEKLPSEVQALIVNEGTVIEDEQVKGEDLIELPEDEKVDDENVLPKAMSYGEEDKYSDVVKDDGSIDEFPESKKNEMLDMDEATERGMALLTKLAEKEPVERKMKPVHKPLVKLNKEPSDDAAQEEGNALRG